MKKKIPLIILLVLLLSAVALIASCNLLNTGSESEVEGIYGIESYFYRDVNKATHNYADKFEYFLLVLNEDKTAKVIYKPVDGTESVLETTYTVTFDTEKPNRVRYVALEQFPLSEYNILSNGTISSTVSNVKTSFELFPMREDLVYSRATFKRDSDDTAVLVKLKYEFNRMYDRVTDDKIERAKKKQASTIDQRVNTEEGSNEEPTNN